MKHVIISAVLFAYLCGCSLEETKQNIYPLDQFASHVEKASRGDTASNRILSELFDVNYRSTPYDIIRTDSLSIGGKNFLYSVIQNPNPVLSKLAVYDNNLRMILLDESLNGYLTSGKFSLSDKRGIILHENFFSADSIELQRTSVYSLIDTSFALAFRSFTRMITGNEIYTQHLRIAGDTILGTSYINETEIGERETFILHSANEAILRGGFFDQLIMKKLGENESILPSSVIHNNSSALWTLGVNTDEESKTINRNEFSILLGKNWTALTSGKLPSLLTARLNGSSFADQSIKAEIFIAKIPRGKKAEDYISIPLSNSARGNYMVRFSDKQELDDKYVQYFDYNCEGLDYILIISAPKKTYDIFKPIYQSIINSFKLDC